MISYVTRKGYWNLVIQVVDLRKRFLQDNFAVLSNRYLVQKFGVVFGNSDSKLKRLGNVVRNIIGRRRNSQDFLSPPQDFYRKPLVRVAPHDLGNFDLVRSLVFDSHHIFVTPLLQFESLLRIFGHRFFRDSASVRFIGQHTRIVLHIAHYHIGNTAQGVVRGDRYRRRFSVDTRASLVHLQINVLGASQTGALEFRPSAARTRLLEVKPFPTFKMREADSSEVR